MLEEKIEKLKNVWSVIRRSDDGRYVVGVTFPDGYGVYDSADSRIHVLDDTKGESGLYWYVAQNLSVTLSEVIEFIGNTVDANIEAIKKAQLYELKVKELRDFFADTDMSYSELEALTFKFKEETKTKEQPAHIPTIDIKPKKANKTSKAKKGEIVSSYGGGETGRIVSSYGGGETGRIVAVEEGNATVGIRVSNDVDTIKEDGTATENSASAQAKRIVDGVDIEALKGEKK
jgi:hypothetical protein